MVKKIIFGLFTICLLLFAGCSNNLGDEKNESKFWIANPASKNCVDNGGKLEIRKDSVGNQYGVCVFETFECDEWAFMRGECNDSVLPVEVNDFDSCVAAGNPTTKSIPAQCSSNGQIYIQKLALKEVCEIKGGNWIASANECEMISKDDCLNLGGNFNECASACRNNPEAEMCTMQCVLVCEFDKKDEVVQEPKICTMEYAPVCGINGVTYSNKCTADDVEVAYDGDCGIENAFKESKTCTREYAPVCGADLVTYSNRCMAGNMEIKYFGECFSEEQKKACELKGGKYEQLGRMQMYQCNMPTNDSGKTCKNGDECEGICLAENGKGVCSEMTLNFGCIPIIQNGDEVTICID